MRRSFKRIVKTAKVPLIRIHDLRHTCIMLARDAGLDLRVTMQIYSNVAEARKRKAAESLGELLNDI